MLFSLAHKHKHKTNKHVRFSCAYAYAYALKPGSHLRHNDVFSVSSREHFGTNLLTWVDEILYRFSVSLPQIYSEIYFYLLTVEKKLQSIKGYDSIRKLQSR